MRARCRSRALEIIWAIGSAAPPLPFVRRKVREWTGELKYSGESRQLWFLSVKERMPRSTEEKGGEKDRVVAETRLLE